MYPSPKKTLIVVPFARRAAGRPGAAPPHPPRTPLGGRLKLNPVLLYFAGKKDRGPTTDGTRLSATNADHGADRGPCQLGSTRYSKKITLTLQAPSAMTHFRRGAMCSNAYFRFRAPQICIFFNVRAQKQKAIPAPFPPDPPWGSLGAMLSVMQGSAQLRKLRQALPIINYRVTVRK